MIYNITRNRPIAVKVKMAENFFSRLKGLMFEKNIPSDIDALVIKPCYSIHSFFMNFPIDAAFVSKSGEVIKILKGFKPWKVAAPVAGSFMVIETAEGFLSEDRISVGDIVELRSCAE